MDRKKILRNHLISVLEMVNPMQLIPKAVKLDIENWKLIVNKTSTSLSSSRPIYITGTGKAAASMAAALEKVLGNRIKDGVVISSPNPLHTPTDIRVLTGSHPYPDKSSIEATNQLIRFIDQIPQDALVLNLISGGTSSLLCRPSGDITLEDLNQTFRMLIASGAPIDRINTVRKVCSEVKGGKLLQHYRGLDIIDLIISDVPDDNPADIGSGPTTSQMVSPKAAQSVIEEYNLTGKVPETVLRHIEAQKEPDHPPIRDGHRQFTLSSARKVSEQAAKLFEENGFAVSRESEPWSGPITDFEQMIFDKIDFMNPIKDRPQIHIFYGECTVEIEGDGKGGRNQELALRIGNRLAEGSKKAAFLSAGTDGIDGPTDAAGAVVDEESIPAIEKSGRLAADHLNQNDSYHFFEGTDCHIITGPTGNNVMDLQFLMRTEV
ncbi:MAG: DUF4147 domain-containing protein [Balneolaceae bacterium]|nr:DUF4147 domain-containing protein [Balneolaceae bacterium]MCH8547879.1 DUF4147 domain-containing protein [Balneolaceae bacterium]